MEHGQLLESGWAKDRDVSNSKSSRLWELAVWEMRNLKSIRDKVSIHPRKESLCVRWSDDGASFASGSEDGEVCVVNALTGAVTGRAKVMDAGVKDLFWAGSGREILALGRNGKVAVWSPGSSENAVEMPVGKGNATGISRSRDGTSAAIVGRTGGIVLVDPDDWKGFSEVLGGNEMIAALDWSPADGQS